ncbi:MAG: ferredoxin reductase family protein [Pseudomonadales bacterium]
MTRRATLAIWVLALIPTFIAAPGLTDADWNSPNAVFNGLGRLTGISGLGFLLVAACISSRVPGFDRAFGGLTKLWRTHHLLGGVAFLLLLAHPLLLAFGRGHSATDATGLLFPAFNAWPIWAGWGALVLMMLFLGPSFSFFGRPPYQRWKWVHKLAAPAIVLALAHAFALDRTLPPPFDYLVWGTLSLLAVAALAYRWLFSLARLRVAGGRFPYKVTDVRPVSQGVVEISLLETGRRLAYEPGQFVYLTPFDETLKSGLNEEHPFTLSSAPAETGLRITIKDLGDASRALQKIRSGSNVSIEGPYGAFFPRHEDDSPELWIAGGIGITPFLSRARTLRQPGSSTSRICLILCVQDEARALFADELRDIADALPNFEFRLHYFYQQGPLDQTFINACCQDLESRHVYICGPPALLSLASRLALEGGVKANAIHTEEFDLL